MSPSESSLLESLASLAMARINALRSINYIDSPTGLLNRLRLQKDVSYLLAERKFPVWLVAADVFAPGVLNEIVKALGYVFSTELMLHIKERLQRLMPAATPLYKLSPTRFAFILTGPHAEPEWAIALFERIVHAFQEEVNCDNIPIRPHLGLGVLRLLPQHEGGVDWLRCLVSTADHARENDTGWSFYSEHRDKEQLRAFGLLNALPSALNGEDQLSLHYQPKVDLRTGECTSVEALLRWTHPTLGEISPMEFIPLAEKTALIRPVSLWVLTQGMRQLADWQRLGWRFGLSLNMSALDLEDGVFVDHLFLLLEVFAVDVEGLELELTESTLMKRPDMVKAQLERLVAHGVRLAIDDFGTGYSNWAYLREIAATTLKLDQSFARGLDASERDKQIVQAMIQLARSLGYRIVAEGIESEAIYRMLSEWGCDEGQGYHIARPMTAVALLNWFAARGMVPGKGAVEN
ncbi:bifunctional diguanylate cyclase/phosphodiesterase [Pseudomonas sp. RIT-PI-AD]|uniref:putative bifunctional diguanylate cyclase/phosphodiesterase n=1 Tax=Pseudomonas sp. RIT-PI-AD TaxID=3035294 RepID=UPI0021D8957F|nr:bifunctional diguanylate cyclase/phosphodiesterase [Pseudomonas sp. RIT-PI-AD]